MTATTCSICARPDAAAINADLVAGASLRALADRYDVALATLHRHKGHAAVGQVADQSEPTSQDALCAAQERLAALQREQADLPGRLRRAVQQADAATVASLRRREAELPDDIALATIVAARAELAVIDPDIPAAEAAYDEATAAHAAAQAGIAAAHEQARALVRDAEQRLVDAALQKMVAENTYRGLTSRRQELGQRLTQATESALATSTH